MVLDMNERVCVSLPVSDWVQVVAAVGLSHVDLETKERVNSAIYDSVGKGSKVLS